MRTKEACYCVAGLLLTAHPAQAATPQSYVQLIVKACPAVEQTGQDHKPDAVQGYYADPINQGLAYDNVRSPTKDEREAYFATQHCIDVPIPAEATTGGPSRHRHDDGAVHESPWLLERDAVPGNAPCIQDHLPCGRCVAVLGAAIPGVWSGRHVTFPPVTARSAHEERTNKRNSRDVRMTNASRKQYEPDCASD